MLNSKIINAATKEKHQRYEFIKIVARHVRRNEGPFKRRQSEFSSSKLNRIALGLEIRWPFN